MRFFYFNDSITKNDNNFLVVYYLKQNLNNYRNLRDKFNCIDGILTSTQLDRISLNEELNLLDCINSLDKDERTYAYSVFNKYPFEDYLLDDGEEAESFLTEEYKIELDLVKYNADFLFIIYQKNGILFTLPVCHDLEKNKLIITSELNHEYSIDNFYGSHENTCRIEAVIEAYKRSLLDKFDSLIGLIGKCKYSTKYKSGFESCIDSVQKAIIKNTSDAINRNGPSKLFPDGDLIKDVTPSNFRYKVYEMRIHHPVAYRLYFYETEEITYLAMLEKKPNYSTQSEQIRTASSIIKKLVELKN